MAIIAIALSFALVNVDALVGTETIRTIGWLYTFGPEGARAILPAMASSMITVAGLTFSITMLTLQLASSQFGPRLLRNFMQDRGNLHLLFSSAGNDRKLLGDGRMSCNLGHGSGGANREAVWSNIDTIVEKSRKADQPSGSAHMLLQQLHHVGAAGNVYKPRLISWRGGGTCAILGLQSRQAQPPA
jgi:hypothetical protein